MRATSTLRQHRSDVIMANQGIVNHLASHSFSSLRLALATATALVLVASGVLGISPAVAQDNLECTKTEWGGEVCVDSTTGEIFLEAEEVVVVGEAPTEAPTEVPSEVDNRQEKLRNDERGPSGNDGGVVEATSDHQQTEEERLAERSRQASEEEERRAYDCLYNPSAPTCEAKKWEAVCRALAAEEAHKASADHIDIDELALSSPDGGWTGPRQTDRQTGCVSSRQHTREANEAAYRLCMAEIDRDVTACKSRGVIMCTAVATGSEIEYKLPKHWAVGIGLTCKNLYDWACEEPARPGGLEDWTKKCEELREAGEDISKPSP